MLIVPNVFVCETYFWSSDYLETHLECCKNNNNKKSNITEKVTCREATFQSQSLTTVPHHRPPFIHLIITVHPSISHCTETIALERRKFTASIDITPRKFLGSVVSVPSFSGVIRHKIYLLQHNKLLWNFTAYHHTVWVRRVKSMQDAVLPNFKSLHSSTIVIFNLKPNSKLFLLHRCISLSSFIWKLINGKV